MADQDYPDLYAALEASAQRAATAAVAFEAMLGGTEAQQVPVNGFGNQPTLAGRVKAYLDLISQTLESAAMTELRGYLREVPVSADNGAHIFTDEIGFVIAKLLANGDFLTPGTLNGLSVRPGDGDGIEIVDDFGFILAAVRPGGTFFGKPGQGTAAATFIAELNQQVRTDIIQILGYGQSLADGQAATPAISTAQEYNNIMLAGGVNTRPGDPGYVGNAFAPLVERDSGARGETPVSGLCNELVRRILEDGEPLANWTILGSACGRGGRSVEQLSPAPLGEGYYEQMIQMVKDSHATAVAMGKTHSVWAYTWDQGESNYTGPGTRSAYQYAQYQLQIFDQLTTEIASINTQKFRPYIFTYQCSAHRKYSVDAMNVALAQWRLSRERPDVSIVVPAYILPTVAADLLHLTNEGSWLLGAYRSRAIHQTMVRRSGKWRPLEPVHVLWTDTHVDIKFHVPRGELVLDTALAAAAPNFGFDIREADALKTDIISSVTVTAPDTVRVALSRPAATTAVISYGRGRDGDPAASGPVSGARGNLRDTHGLFDVRTSPAGVTYALHNPCVMFQHSRKTGF